MNSDQKQTEMVAARRHFLATCGKFAAATPPAIAMMLSAAERSFAAAGSGVGGPPPCHDHGHRHRRGNNGFGNGPHDGVPGRSGSSRGSSKDDRFR